MQRHAGFSSRRLFRVATRLHLMGTVALRRAIARQHRKSAALIIRIASSLLLGNARPSTASPASPESGDVAGDVASMYHAILDTVPTLCEALGDLIVSAQPIRVRGGAAPPIEQPTKMQQCPMWRFLAMKMTCEAVEILGRAMRYGPTRSRYVKCAAAFKTRAWCRLQPPGVLLDQDLATAAQLYTAAQELDVDSAPQGPLSINQREAAVIQGMLCDGTAAQIMRLRSIVQECKHWADVRCSLYPADKDAWLHVAIATFTQWLFAPTEREETGRISTGDHEQTPETIAEGFVECILLFGGSDSTSGSMEKSIYNDLQWISDATTSVLQDAYQESSKASPSPTVGLRIRWLKSMLARCALVMATVISTVTRRRATTAAQDSRASAAMEPSQSTQERHDERPNLSEDMPPAMMRPMDMIQEEDAHYAPSTDEEAGLSVGSSSPAGQPSSCDPYSVGPQALPSVLNELRAISAERGAAAEARGEPWEPFNHSARTERPRTAARPRQRSGTHNPFASTTSEQWQRRARVPPALDVLTDATWAGTDEPSSAPAHLISSRLEESPESA
jgi:hypothetical protein